MATDPKDVQLTEEQREFLAAKADKTGKSVSDLVDELLVTQPRREAKEGRSFFDVLKEHGMVGTMQGPGDLSTNPKHMEGFGESRVPADSD